MKAIHFTPLGNVAEIRSGVGFPINLQGRTEGTYPFAKVGDISMLARSGASDLHRAKNFVNAIDIELLKSKPFPIDTIVFAKIGEAIRQNFRAILKVPALVDNNVMGVTPDREILDARYLYHYLTSVDMYPLAQSTTVPSIRKTDLERLQVPLPPLAQQRRIVAALDQMEALRAKRRQAIALLDDLTQSIFLDMFGNPLQNAHDWDRLPLGDLLETIDSGVSPQCLDRPVKDGEWGVLKLGAVTKCVYQQGENKALPDGVEPQPRHEVRAGDLLLSRKNTPDLVGAAAYVRHTRSRLLMPDLIFRLVLRQDAPINGVYLHALLTHPGKRRVVQSLASGSAASMVNISKQKLLRLLCEVPPLALQSAFSRRVAIVEKEREVYAAHLSALDEFANSLQHRAFSGTLWDHEAAA
ncbi:restriction endonuclease subunit S [Streptomyces sp. NPDC048241]|uniref:restriction endonuclease subunit S n=1 Tax=Streptomyces sp. NPDC048241 TaxID=3365521 RepID=UPI0037242AB8